MTSASPAAASPGPSRWRSFLSWLASGWWAGIAAILAAIAIAIALWTYEGGEDVAPSIKGNCNAQGNGNTVSCEDKP